MYSSGLLLLSILHLISMPRIPYETVTEDSILKDVTEELYKEPYKALVTNSGN